MNIFSHRKSSLLVGLLSAGLLVVTTSYKNAGDPGNFKNLKVLPQDISKDSLHDLMDGYNAALGVKCNFCHAPKANGERGLDFASDEKKEKGFARHMITMTQNINKNEFNFENSARPDTINIVTCGTCHRGEKEPAPFVAPERKDGPPPPPGKE
ncbi:MULTISPECIES: c-type cytochrome [Chitinophagaceae]